MLWRLGAPLALGGWRFRRPCATLALLLLLLLYSAYAQSFPEKRSEMSPMPFVLTSRYGRGAPDRPARPARPARADRFFLSGRYGKRSEAPSLAPDGPSGVLACRYTGIYALYRCVPTAKHTGSDKRKSADGIGPGGR